MYEKIIEMSDAEKLFWTVVLLLCTFVFMGATDEGCSHLSGADYDRCHIAQVRGR